MATIAALIVDVAANTANIDRSTRQINTQLDSISSTASKMAKGLAAAFTISAVVDAGKQVLDYAGKITDMSARLQVSTTTIQEWEAAFGPSGVSIDTVAKSAAELANKITGNDKSAVAALKAMGLSLSELKTLSPEAQFNKVADAVGNLQNQGERIYASKTLFGKGGVELLSALDGKLQENIQSFNDLGLIIDEQTIKAADDFGDQLGMMGKQLLGITASIVGPLLPALSALGNVLAWLGQNIVGPVLGGAIKVAMTLLAGFVEVVAGLLSRLASLGSNLPFVGEKFKAMAGALDDVSKRSGAYMADLWKLENGTSAAGDASAKAAPKLIGLGDAIDEGDKKAAKAAEQMRKLAEAIAKIDAGVGRGLASATQVIGQSLDEFSRGLENGLGPSFRLVGTVINEIANRDLPKFDASLGITLGKLTGANKQLASIPRTLGDTMKSLFSGDVTKVLSDGGAFLKNGLSKIGTGILEGFGNIISSGISQLVSLGIGAVVKGIGKLFGNTAEKQVNPIREAFVQAAGGLDMLNRRAHDAGVTLDHMLDARTPEAYKRAIDELNAAFEFQDQAMQTLDETVKKYNFTNSQIGPVLQRQELGKKFEELFQDYQVLHAGGVDQVAITQQMSAAVSKYVQDARKMGIEIPAAMRPMLENFAQNGDLIDENGHAITDLSAYGVTWAESMTESVAKIIKSVQDLVDAIDRGLGAAIRNIPQPVVTGRVQWATDPVPGGNDGIGGDAQRYPEPVPMAFGGSGFADRPMLFSTQGNEEFAFSGEGKRFTRGGESASVLDFSELKAELAALRQQQAASNEYFQSMFPRDLARVMTSEQQKTARR